ncbi:MAG: hypothetical protein H6658_02205 [Ardenticatenaceae bacterium]|nr:hypothetical protein [Ardenticatenaceae bacterium]
MTWIAEYYDIHEDAYKVIRLKGCDSEATAVWMVRRLLAWLPVLGVREI